MVTVDDSAREGPKSGLVAIDRENHLHIHKRKRRQILGFHEGRVHRSRGEVGEVRGLVSARVRASDVRVS
jgi:hypothetical protein